MPRIAWRRDEGAGFSGGVNESVTDVLDFWRRVLIVSRG